MERPENPFFTSTIIPDPYFCDRQAEIARMTEYIANGSNFVLKAPRRIGKSSLIKHFLGRNEIASRYNTLYVDVYGTVNAAEFILELQNSFLSAPFARSAKVRKEVETLIRSVHFSLSPDQFGGIGASIGPDPGARLSLSLSEMFAFLEKTKKPNIVVFDEFQQIEKYPERMAAILRSKIQEMTHTRFIFSGSEPHMLESMFNDANKPFYKSSSSMTLDLIPLTTYTEFCRKNFAAYGKEIQPEAVEYCYYIFYGNTFDMQEVMKRVFGRTSLGKCAGKRDIEDAIDSVLDENDGYYREILSRIISVKDRSTLFAIAAEGIASGITSSGFMKKYRLDNASSVQNAIKILTDERVRLVSRCGKATYCLQDTFLELWIDRRVGNIRNKLSRKQELFEKWRNNTDHVDEICRK